MRYQVLRFVMFETTVEADSPEEARDLEADYPIYGELTSPEAVDFRWWFSDCMGVEVLDEQGESVLEDW